MNSIQPKVLPGRKPKYDEVLIRPNVLVPMRDGVKLATDIYLPASDGKVADEPMPALLARTPYDKGPSNNTAAMRLARHGYMVVWQDVRGRFASEGEFLPFIQEAEDGYDTIEWVAAQPQCDKRVGTFGGSYLAYAQAAAATQNPPHLTAMCHYFGYPHGYHSAHQGGALDIFWLSYYVMMAGNGKEAMGNSNVSKALMQMSFEEWLHRLPLREGLSPLALAPSYERIYFNILRHDCMDEFWAKEGLSPAEHLEKWSNVPTLWVCGWFDHYAYCHPDTLIFTRLIQIGHKHQYVIFGPWAHGDVGRKIGQTTFGECSTLAAAFPDYELRWFDRWLKGIDDDGLFPARAQYFVMGGGDGSKTEGNLLSHGGEWKTTDTWPVADVTSERRYFDSNGNMTLTPPTVAESFSAYCADPENPVPSSTDVCYTVTRLAEGGTRRINTNGAWDQVEGPHLYGCKPPYLPLSSRDDVLVFQTEPLSEEIEVTGHPTVELWISSDAPDTDFVAKLIDVYPSSEDYPHGFALGISEGIQRAKFRNSFNKPELLKPGEIYQVRVQMRPLSNLFKQGHRIRVDICSSSCPHFDVNTHTGRNPSLDRERRIAHNTIYHDKDHPSCILLPVAENE